MNKPKMKTKALSLMAAISLLTAVSVPLTAVAADTTYTELTQAIDLKTKATISTDADGVSIVTDSKGNAYQLTQNSVLYSSSGTLSVYLYNTQPVNIDSIIAKGTVRVRAGAGQLNVTTSNPVAIDVNRLNVTGTEEGSKITASGAEVGIRAKNYVEIGKVGIVEAKGEQKAVETGSYVRVRNGGELYATASQDTAVAVGSSILVGSGSTLQANGETALNGITATGYLRAENGAKIVASGTNNGIKVGTNFIVYKNANVTANASAADSAGVYIDRGYGYLKYSAQVVATGGKYGVRANKYYAVLNGSESLNVASSAEGEGTRVDNGYVKVYTGANLTSEGGNVGLYSKSYQRFSTGTTVTTKGGTIGTQSDRYILAEGKLVAEGSNYGVISQGNIYTNKGAELQATATGEAGVGIKVVTKATILARGASQIEAKGNAVGIDNELGIVESRNKGSVITATSYGKPINAKEIRESLNGVIVQNQENDEPVAE